MEEPQQPEQPTAEAHPADDATELVVITGMSGAGRSEAIHTFEDLGYFTVDNLPPSFIRQLIDLAQLPDSPMRRLAVVSDVRSHEFFDELADELSTLRQAGVRLDVLFLEADDDTLLRRFKETRRPHPLAEESDSLLDGIMAERFLLQQVREQADMVIDTSEMKPLQLRQAIRERFIPGSATDALAVSVSSFGFKYGTPSDADLVIDVRFLPNPYYDPELRPLTGLDPEVRDFVMGRPQTAEFLDKWFELLDVLVPGYVAEGKHHLAIALGCTGGMHRSVALAEATASHLREKGFRAVVAHRDMGRDREAR
jgi:RNase adapter protein RapZ